MANFDEWASRLRDRVRQMEAEGPSIRPARPAETPDGVLYYECYLYFRKLKRSGKLELLAGHLANQPESRWLRHKGDGVDNVLRLLEHDKGPWFIPPSRRGRIAVELRFADRFNVHPRLLLAFLFEAGPHQRILMAARSKKSEPWARSFERLSALMRTRTNNAVPTN